MTAPDGEISPVAVRAWAERQLAAIRERDDASIAQGWAEIERLVEEAEQ